MTVLKRAKQNTVKSKVSFGTGGQSATIVREDVGLCEQSGPGQAEPRAAVSVLGLP